jgi:hypothetical protein
MFLFVFFFGVCSCFFSGQKVYYVLQDGSNVQLVSSSGRGANNLIEDDAFFSFFCQNSAPILNNSLGALLMGRIYRNFPITSRFPENVVGAKICNRRLTTSVLTRMRQVIEDGYQLTLKLGPLSASVPLGDSESIFNHFSLTVHYYPLESGSDFGVRSIDLVGLLKNNTLKGEEIDFTFNLHFSLGLNSESNSPPILLTTLVTLLFNAVVIFALIKISTKKPEKSDLLSDDLDDSFWQLARGDIFRCPFKVYLLSAIVGLGLHIVVAVMITGLWTLLDTEAVLARFITVLAATGFFCGLFSVTLFKHMGGIEWRRALIACVCILPTVLTSALLLYHIILWKMASVYLFIWRNIVNLSLYLILEIALVVLGFFVGLRIPLAGNPVKVNLIPQQVVKAHWSLRFLSWTCGLYVFFNLGTDFGEILHLLYGTESSSCRSFAYAMVLKGSAASFAASLCSVVIKVKRGDYRWWWTAFSSAGYVGVWYFVMAVIHGIGLGISGKASWVIFLIQNLVIGGGFALCCGSLGLLFSFIFLRRLYAQIARSQ